MEVIRYATRSSIATAETTYQVTDDELNWSSAQAHDRLQLVDVQLVRLFTSPGMRWRGMGQAPSGGFEQCVVRIKDGRTVSLTSKHYQSLGVFEDRGPTFAPFVAALLARVAAIQPTAVFLVGMPAGVWWLWLGVLVLMAMGTSFGVLMVIDAASGRGTVAGLLLGIVFTVGTGISLRSVWRMVRHGRSQPFDPRSASPQG